MKTLFPKIESFVQEMESSGISDERKELLLDISSFLQAKRDRKEDIKVSFICTHNSRRSQLCQVWAQVAIYYYGLDNMESSSGGTEATAFHPNALKALEQVGFSISQDGGNRNPNYTLQFSEEAQPVFAFSKHYDEAWPEATDFIAILTCSDAEANCPFIPDAEKRFALKYQDPKFADGTPEQEQEYANCSKKIATEMFYLFSKLN